MSVFPAFKKWGPQSTINIRYYTTMYLYLLYQPVSKQRRCILAY